MWQVAQLTPVFFTSVKNSIWPSRRSRCAVPVPKAPGNDVVPATPISAGSLGLVSSAAIDVVNWFTTQSVLPSGAIAIPRGPLWTPTGLFVAQQTTGSPSTSVGHPVQLASVVQATPRFDVKAPQTFAPKAPTVVGRASVGTVTSVGSGSDTT